MFASALLSQFSLMFWTNWNEQRPSIMRSTLAGKNMRIIISTDILTPNGLTVDHKAEKLYFSDGTIGKIERCDYDGSSRYVSVKRPFFVVPVKKDFLLCFSHCTRHEYRVDNTSTFLYCAPFKFPWIKQYFCERIPVTQQNLFVSQWWRCFNAKHPRNMALIQGQNVRLICPFYPEMKHFFFFLSSV